MAINYNEIVNNDSPSIAGFSINSANAVMTLSVAPEDLLDAIIDLLGDVERGTDSNENYNGTLNRTLPKAHPDYPWLYASNISNIQGKRFVRKASARPRLEAPSLSHFALYEEYWLTVEFTPRKYRVFPNLGGGDIVSWTTEDGTSSNYRDSLEYRRFTYYESIAQPEVISGSQGFMVFYTNSGGNPNDMPFPAYPRMIYPKTLIKYTWYQVPHFYVTEPKSWITRGIGRINQTQFRDFSPGSLLYLGYTTSVYTPPVPEMDSVVSYSTEKLCDIEFTFEYTDRVAEDAPTPSNANWIVDGHNALPWLPTREFYYAVANLPNPDDWAPLHYSFPFQLLFTDPILLP